MEIRAHVRFGAAVNLAGLEAVDAPARFRLMPLQLPRLPLSFWSVSWFDQRNMMWIAGVTIHHLTRLARRVERQGP